MQHIDHHTLELFALNAPTVNDRRAAIEEHLAACAGCRSLVARMVESFGHVEELVSDLDTSTTVIPERLPTSSPRGIAPATPRRIATTPLQPPSRLVRIRFFMRHHPVITGAGSFMMLAALLLAGSLIFRSSAPVRVNPAYIRYDEATNAMEILDRNYQYLWRIPTRSKPSQAALENLKILVRDIDGDGYNEVAATLNTPSETLAGDYATFRVFESGGTQRMQRRFQAHAKYLSRRYQDNWSARFCVIDPESTGRKKDLLVAWDSGRSPEVLTRMTSDGLELGQYWHFGNILYASFVDLGTPLGPSLLMMGVDDAEDTVGLSCPFVTVLDPKRLVNAGKSVASQGFNMQTSEAERMYIRLPVSPLSKALVHGNFAEHGTVNNDGTISIWVVDQYNEAAPDLDICEYIFSRQMVVLEVKSSTATDRYYEKMVRKGLVTGRIDAAYLAALKDGVRYWDGAQWVKDPVCITHPPAVAQQPPLP